MGGLYRGSVSSKFGGWAVCLLSLGGLNFCTGCPGLVIPVPDEDGNTPDGDGNTDDPCTSALIEKAGGLRRGPTPSRKAAAGPAGKGAVTAQQTDPGFEDGNLDETVTSPLGKTSGEPNNRFDNPVVAVFNQAGSAELKGMVETQGDLDVYLLGALNVGDRMVVDALAADGSVVDVAVGLFDAEERLVFSNDDRTPDNLNSRIDHVIRHAGERYYLVVTHAAFAVRGTFTGSYTVNIAVTPGQTIPAPQPQILLLDFDGGPITSPDLPSLPGGVVPAFDACEINAIYRGETQEMKRAIVATVEQNYRNFDVVIRTSDDPPPAEGTKFTTMLFGGFRNGIFGIAEDVDLYNIDHCDDGIIFTETFVLDFFTFVPTVEEMGIAIGNVAAHEAGHLLGLNHVDDDLDLMDTTSPADAFVEDQEFLNSPLSSDIMPIGTQDSVLLLNETVGPAS